MPGPAPPPIPRRRLWLWIGGALLLLAIVATAATVALRRVDLGRLAAARASAALGRDLRFGTLRIVPGAWIAIDATDLRLANPPGAAAPDMLHAGQAHAELNALSLLLGPLRLRHVRIADATLRLEPAGAAWNWRFGNGYGNGSGATRVAVPLLLDAAAINADILYIRRRGGILRTHLAQARVETAGGRIAITASGAYQTLPLTLEAELAATAPLTMSGNIPARATARSGDATLGFQGTLTDPLDVDGLDGALSLAAPHAAPLLAAAGDALPDFPLQIAGHFQRRGDDWQLADATGRAAGIGFTAPRLDFHEGARGAPDSAIADLRLDRLDAKALPAARAGAGGGPDLPLFADPHPDPLLDIRLATPELVYGALRFTDATAALARLPGRIDIHALAFSWLGAALQASGQLLPAPGGGRLDLALAVRGAGLEPFRRFLGLGALPLSGTLNARAAITAQGATLDTATQAARVQAVASLQDGRLDRRIVRLASTDLRLLLGRAPGTTPITCLLAVADLRGSSGTVSPFRLATPDGTLVGSGSFDLRRRTLDLVLGTQRRTTDFWALDVAMRASGPFADPRILPAKLSPQGRAGLANLGTLPQLPPDLLAEARANPCFIQQRKTPRR